MNLPRTRQQNEKLREERRKEILEAAITLFARNGFTGTGVSDVAKAAGVSHGTVFLYFPSKEALFEAALLEPLAEAEEPFMGLGRMEGSPRERIARMVREQLNAFARQESYVRLTQYVLGLRDRFPELSQHLFDFAAKATRTLAAVIAEGQALGELPSGDPEHIAWAYFSYLNGTVLIHMAPADNPVWATAAEMAMRIFGIVEEGK